MSIINPTNKEIKDYFIQSLKDHLIHYKHLLIYQWHRKKGMEFYCTICSSKEAKRNDEFHKHIQDTSKKCLHDDYMYILHQSDPVKWTDSYYIRTQLEPVIKHLWLCKSIRNAYRHASYDYDARVHKTYALIKHTCGHKDIDMVLDLTPKKLSNINDAKHSFHRMAFIMELRVLRYSKCDNCIFKGNKHILLRWYNSRLQRIKIHVSYIMMCIKHIEHLLSHKYHRYCIKCIERALMYKFKSHKRKIIMKF